jgi:hypothetical protein
MHKSIILVGNQIVTVAVFEQLETKKLYLCVFSPQDATNDGNGQVLF